jgi:SNF2 family DNA or RNA helicase
MTKDAPLASARAREVLKSVMLRRTKHSKREDGRPLLQLPEKDLELTFIEFSEEERALYEDIEKTARVRINRFMKRGTLLKKLARILKFLVLSWCLILGSLRSNAAVLVMMLRLRQLCCHPYLILVRLCQCPPYHFCNTYQ